MKDFENDDQPSNTHNNLFSIKSDNDSQTNFPH